MSGTRIENSRSFIKRIPSSSKEMTFLKELLKKTSIEGHFQVETYEAIYSPTLLTSFVNYWQNMKTRLSDNRALWFNDKSWSKKDDLDLRKYVMSRFENYVELFSWNEDENIPPIIPAVHGTGYNIAQKICMTGFAALSTLDAGYYGKGIYFTESGLYAVPYFGIRRDPAIIISYIIPGNPYPTTEHRAGEDSLLGSALMNGHMSHFVVVRKNGNPIRSIPNTGDEFFYEIVIGQEAQIVPAFVLAIGKPGLSELLKKYQRDIQSMDLEDLEALKPRDKGKETDRETPHSRLLEDM
eukprot:TRINITY_DN9294_c0_g1_i1.p1 TRINITY_DN9294_c0_g1~~TRINITY_DN9294_c0_g1_i1.p1  ORF type:complete len:313 (-),score=49.00 TRINITY_DN9294_c0_g1_i1:47-934(-)